MIILILLFYLNFFLYHISILHDCVHGSIVYPRPPSCSEQREVSSPPIMMLWYILLETATLIKQRTRLADQRPFSCPFPECWRSLDLFDEVLLILLEHQVVLHLVTARDVVQVFELVQELLWDIHVGDPLL